MLSTVKRLAATSSIAAACMGVLLTGSGCDSESHKADKQVRSTVVQSGVEREKGTKDAVASSHKLLETAVADTLAPAETKAAARAALAQADIEAANQIIRQIEADRMQISHLVNAIALAGNSIQSCNTLIDSYQQQDPQAVTDSITKKIAEARGGAGNAVWIPHDKAPLPTENALAQEISRIEGEIAKTEAEIQSLKDQRVKLTDEAEAAYRSSQAKQDQASVDDFKRSADLRNQAAKLAIKIDNDQLALVPLRRDLAIAQGEKKIVAGLVAALEESSRQVKGSWEDIQKEIEIQRGKAKEILAGGVAAAPTSGPAYPVSINAKAAELARLVAEVQANQTKADALLDSATKRLDEAAGLADTFVKETTARQNSEELRNRGAERDALGKSVDMCNPSLYRLQQAEVLHAKASLQTAQVIALAQRTAMITKLESVLTAAQLPMPKELDKAPLAGQVESARKPADESYKAADTILVSLKDAPKPATESLRNSARASRVILLFGQWQVADSAGDPSAAKGRLSEAVAERKAAIDEGILKATAVSTLGPVLKITVPDAPAPAPAPTPESPAPTPATEPSADIDPSAKAAANQFVDAFYANDVSVINSMAQVSPEQSQYALAQAAGMKAAADMSEAARTKLNVPGDPLPKTHNVTITADGDAVKIAFGPFRDPPAVMKKVDGTWKVVELPPAKDALSVDMIQKVTAKMQQVTADINSGKITTVEQWVTATQDGKPAPAAPETPAPAPAAPEAPKPE